jgi:hypothetical protein
MPISADCQFGERGSCGGCYEVAFGIGGKPRAATLYGKSAAGYVIGVATFSADFFNALTVRWWSQSRQWRKIQRLQQQ